MIARRAPMRRGKPLRRTKRLTSKRSTSSYARRERNRPFMDFVRAQPCSVLVDAPDPQRITPCGGRIEADHLGERGLSHLADDETTAPMCTDHHDQRTNHFGAFRNLNKTQVRAWRARAIDRTQAAWSARR